ncbi:MAG: GTPase [Dermatophilaceae bacterium]
MSPFTLGRGGGSAAVTAESLRAHAAALEDALVSGGAQLPHEEVARARGVLTKVTERGRHTGAHTVVALAGATGSGKSSLFNAVVGGNVATIGARRPTTSTPTAAVWGPAPAGDLLDWLEVGSRHQVTTEPGTPLDGLVLLDLPDFDSRESANRLEAERVLEFVDVFVWVTDPQKYADARLHDDYVSAMRHYDAVTLVVLNQADRLTPGQLDQCAGDLRRLLHLDGLTNADVLATSARTGLGVAALRSRLAEAVAGAKAARTRLDADVRTAADTLRRGVGDEEVSVSQEGTAKLVDALGRASGVPAVVDAVAHDYRRGALASGGWPFTRWVARLRPDPLRRLRLDRDTSPSIDTDIRRAVGRSSLPQATPAARAAVDLAARRLADAAADGLPRRWAEAVAAAALPPQERLADELDQAIVRTRLRGRQPVWWTVVRLLQWVFALITLVGLAWSLVQLLLGTGGLIQLPSIYVGPVSLPLVLLVGGLLAGWLLALLSRWFAGVGSRRAARAARRRLDEAVKSVATGFILGPVADVLDRHRLTRTQLDAARR